MTKQLSVTEIGKQIYFIRGHRVLLDSDLASLYEVETKALKRAVRRNISRFPTDFMFQLTRKELKNLRYQIGTSSLREESVHGGTRHMPFVFTEHGVTMLASILNSKRAIKVNIAIVRTFVQLRGLLDTNKKLATKLNQLEKKYDYQFKVVFDAIRELVTNSLPSQKRIKGLDN